jgi:hypothetical protein
MVELLLLLPPLWGSSNNPTGKTGRTHVVLGLLFRISTLSPCHPEALRDEHRIAGEL